MADYTLNSYIINHNDGKSEQVDAESAEKALKSLAVPETESKVKQLLMIREGIRVSVPDNPDKVALTVAVENIGIAENPDNRAFPSLTDFCVGDSVSLGAAADPRYDFIGWYKNGAQISTNPDFTYLAVQSDSPALEIMARFSLRDVPIATAVEPAGGGTAFCSVDGVRPNTTIRFMATPSSGHEFSHWERKGISLSNDAIASISVSPLAEDETIAEYKAVFTSL